ncbi:nudC domain-containing protein 1 isoform X2 [Gambusia affinis]|uniref:nudC domain-containing protein 1 isoform X2 n=1 Tax=Gambusia affinis TaxID=33528 RepID=UPI001CDCC1E4|nr:nudC domain-containing protein 1 isoform X2 [Gambusia affinis]
MAAANYSLKVNRDLLDPNFESYRLSLDPIPTYTVELDAAVEELQLKDAHYTLEHLQAFGMFNHLQLDPWYQDSVLFVDSRGRVLSLSVTLDTALGKPKEVFSFGSESGRAEDRLCASISLTSATWAALSDGTGQLLLLRTGRRGDGGACRWEVLFSDHMGEPFTILHSVSHVQGGCHSVEVLLLRVQKEPLESTGSGYSVSLEWVTVGGAAGSGQERKYEVRKRRVLRGKSVPHYAAVAPRGEGLMLAAEKPFVFTHVNGRPVEPPPPPELSELDKTDPLYFWQQTAEDLTVCVRLPGGVAKEDVSFRLTADSLSIGVRGCPPIVEGQLYASVDPEASAWTISDSNSLEVSLQKLSEGPMWPELVLGNRTGELVLSNQQAALIHDRLTHLTSEDPRAGKAAMQLPGAGGLRRFPRRRLQPHTLRRGDAQSDPGGEPGWTSVPVLRERGPVSDAVSLSASRCGRPGLAATSGPTRRPLGAHRHLQRPRLRPGVQEGQEVLHLRSRFLLRRAV